jgi:hypothetical protein
MEGCSGIDSVALLEPLDRVVGHVSRDASAGELLDDAATRRAGPEHFRASELPRKVGIIEQLLVEQLGDGRFDLLGFRAFLKQLATELGDGPSAELEEAEGLIVRGRPAQA